jgi:hypothetical protein
MMFGMVASCALSSDQVYKLYSGNVRPNSEIATLRFGAQVHEIIIDGMKVNRTDYGLVKIDAGPHEIRWDADFIVSVLVNPSGYDKTETAVTVELEAGHTYTVNADRTTGHGYGMYLWITDDNSGETVAGTKKP